jgi:7-keto-8-aminopelargonate synthetase-like enzyme
VTNQYLNIQKSIAIGNPSWESACESQLTDLLVEHIGNARLRDQNGHEFINMCSCSYLGLDVHPRIVQAAADFVLRARTVNLPTSRIRIRLGMLDEAEEALSSHFRCEALTALSCSAASVAVLPLLAAGVFSGGERPLMIFDKHCHFSMNQMKPNCGDETTVVSCNHNDIDFIEDACKKNKAVAYVAEGAYSMGGQAPVRELIRLQEQYGLYLYFDDAHSLSVYGERGEGYVRSFMPELHERTIIVCSLAKAFGSNGGVIFLGPKKQKELVKRFGGPMSYSQYINPATIGATIASVEVHRSPEFRELQQRFNDNIKLFDEILPTAASGNGLPIRLVVLHDAELAIQCSELLFKEGFYSSAVFFPIVARNQAGLRVMVRSDMDPADIRRFATLVTEFKSRVKSPAADGQRVEHNAQG